MRRGQAFIAAYGEPVNVCPEEPMLPWIVQRTPAVTTSKDIPAAVAFRDRLRELGDRRF